MWFGSPEGNTDQKASQSFSSSSDRGQETIQGIINSTTCFDLMRNSSKVCDRFVTSTKHDIDYQIVLFETTIPFHLAFMALAEHGMYY